MFQCRFTLCNKGTVGVQDTESGGGLFCGYRDRRSMEIWYFPFSFAGNLKLLPKIKFIN